MREIGIFIGATERGYNPEDLDYIKAAAEVWDENGGPAARLLFKAARDLFIATGREHCAPAFHLHFLSKSADWNTHAKEVAQHLVQTMEVLEPMRKQAFSLKDVASAGALAGRGALLGSVGAGAGLGSLYWMLSRHSNQDNADIEAMQKQVQYYRELSKELEDSMRRKYRYDRGQQPAAGNTAVAA